MFIEQGSFILVTTAVVIQVKLDFNIDVLKCEDFDAGDHCSDDWKPQVWNLLGYFTAKKKQGLIYFICSSSYSLNIKSANVEYPLLFLLFFFKQTVRKKGREEQDTVLFLQQEGLLEIWS